MKIYQAKNVYEAALERVEFLYNEFPNVEVAVSGGKDSTVILHLCLEVARKLNRLPVRAYFLDQEAEWRQTVEYMRVIQAMPDVSLRWFQIQFDIFNATSHTDDMLHCWRLGDDWIRPKEPDAIKENTFGVNRFHDFLDQYSNFFYADSPCCTIGGVRAEESPQRASGLTNAQTYKHITYGKILSRQKGHYVFYPIYDWRIQDVWHYIASNGFPYNSVYDLFFQKGIPLRDMRVSNLTHEVAIRSLLIVQDIERDTWDDIVGRLDSANSLKHLKEGAMFCPKDLPPMFVSWPEYRDYLLENIVSDTGVRKKMAHKFELCDRKLVGTPLEESLYREEITAIIRNDHYFTRLDNFMTRFRQVDYKQSARKGDCG